MDDFTSRVDTASPASRQRITAPDGMLLSAHYAQQQQQQQQYAMLSSESFINDTTVGGHYSDSTAAYNSHYQFVASATYSANRGDVAESISAAVATAAVITTATTSGGGGELSSQLVYTIVAPEFFSRISLNESASGVLAYSFPPLSMDWRIEYYAHYVAMPILLFFGLIFQCLNILTLNKLQAAGYLYLKASALADVLSIFALIPFVLRHGGVHNPYDYREMFFHAHIELPLINALIALSTLCLTMMTIDRFLSIYFAVKCFKCCGAHAKLRIYVGIAALSALVVLIFVPSAWQRTLVPFVESDVVPPYGRRVFWRIGRNFQLRDSWLFSKYIVLREFVTRILPMILITILNVFITHKLRKISNRRNSRCAVRTEMARERDQDRSRLGWLLVMTSAIFVTCNLPACLLSFYYHYVGYNSMFMQVFRAVANCVQVSHYLHYFYLYTLYSSEYRRALCSVFAEFCCLYWRPRNNYTPGCVAKNDGEYDGAKRRSTLHTPLPTTTATENTVRSRLSSILLGQIRQYGGLQRHNRKMKSPGGNGALMDGNDATVIGNGYMNTGVNQAYLGTDLNMNYVTKRLCTSDTKIGRSRSPVEANEGRQDERAREEFEALDN